VATGRDKRNLCRPGGRRGHAYCAGNQRLLANDSLQPDWRFGFRGANWLIPSHLDRLLV
jgi:hypothetical protein